MTTDHQKLFLQITTSLFRVQQSVTDLFFINRLNEEIENMIDKYIQDQIYLSKESQCEYVRSLKDLDKVLQEIIYLKKGDIVQLAVTQEQVLRYLYNFFQEIRTQKQISIEPEVVVKSVDSVPHSAHQKSGLITASVLVTRKSVRNNKRKLNKNQEKILEFVRQEPDCRTKDVVNQFSALSQRTVKRGLKELSEEGRIIKKTNGAAVYYSVV